MMVRPRKRDSNLVEQERARENDRSRAQCNYAEILRKHKNSFSILCTTYKLSFGFVGVIYLNGP